MQGNHGAMGGASGDTASTSEANLALALSASEGAADVDFATAWGQGYMMAERAAAVTGVFIAWVNDCYK